MNGPGHASAFCKHARSTSQETMKCTGREVGVGGMSWQSKAEPSKAEQSQDTMLNEMYQ